MTTQSVVSVSVNPQPTVAPGIPLTTPPGFNWNIGAAGRQSDNAPASNKATKNRFMIISIHSSSLSKLVMTDYRVLVRTQDGVERHAQIKPGQTGATGEVDGKLHVCRRAGNHVSDSDGERTG